MPKLPDEEKDLVESVEAGEWKSVDSKESELKRFQEYARSTFKKDRRINIRISAKDLQALQKKALVEGVPYQTLISSVLHKYVSGRFKD
jgi:predicted DNA binding CopG/RHH family protein